MADNPLLKALPPETDYISYLTILEYNLTAEQLPTLHEILQDTTLTANIGWDLVHLLLPLLPASRECLQDVARLGNPREVVLKVTEMLEGIGAEDEDEEDEAEGEETEDVAEGVEELKIKDEKASGKEPESSVHPALRPQEPQETPKSPSKAVRFSTLLEMLSILHPRIKTKYPSRFLSTSLQSILPAFMQIARKLEATEAVLGFIKALSGTKRPKLPPRKSSSAMLTQSIIKSAPDPEGKDEALGTDEVSLQSRLLQSFLTFVTEGYMSSMAADEDVPGIAWSSRYQEKLHPEKIIPGRRTYTDLFTEDESLHERDTVIGQILALARDLKLSAEELLASTTKPEEEEDEDVELPSIPTDVPLSHTGSLYLLSTMAASSALFDAPASLPSLSLVPDFAIILASSLGDSATGSTGAEPEPLIDAVLFLGFLIINSGRGIPPDNGAAYNNILQRLSLLSANMPSPALRYHAHVLTCSILHAHPSDHVRLAFIGDTLEHCPYENLKASAIGWLKDEILAAEMVVQAGKQSDKTSIFATPACLTTLAPFLFPNPNELMEGQSTPDSYATFQAHQGFYLAVLNLIYLLLSSPALLSRLQIATLVQEWGFPNLLHPLLSAANKFSASIRNEELGFGDDEGKDAALASMDLVIMHIQEVMDAKLKAGFRTWELGADTGPGAQEG